LKGGEKVLTGRTRKDKILYLISAITIVVFCIAVSGFSIAVIAARSYKAAHTENIQAAEKVEIKKTEKVVKEEPEFEIPSGDTAFKSYMSYRAITNTRSAQYKLQQQCWTDDEGLRRYQDDYVIALGTYYADHIGERFKITLDTGESFTAVVGDFKANRHTDSKNQYYDTGNGRKNIVEFVVDTKELNPKARRMGDISYISGFEGNIKSIETAKTKKGNKE
jgi:hypothetical protein